MKCEWKTYQVGDLCSSVSETYKGKDEYVVLINTSDVLEGKILNHSLTPNANLKGQFKKTFQTKDILYSEIRPANKRFAFVGIEDTQNYIASTKLMVIRANTEVIMPEYLFIFLQMPAVIAELQMLAETRSGTFPQITFSSEISPLNISLPDKGTQNRIVEIFRSLDDKIELNNKINENLERQARALFEQKFIAEDIDGEDRPLYDFADYINGAAFKPSECGDRGLPIVKIAELKNGITDSTKYYDGFKGEKYLLHNKDILFSWSGNPDTSIDIFIWAHGKAILNQHTFNVKSNTEHRWFTFLMLKYFKPEFSRIARNKQTTGLGHVTAKDLKRLTFIFNESAIEAFEREVSPFMEMVYSNMIENQRLAQLRDNLLPQLMSGEIDASSIQF